MRTFFRRQRSEHAESEPISEQVAPEQVAPEQVAPEAAETSANGDSEATSPLVERLQNMDWPKPPDEVRERCLREIMSKVGEGGPEPSDGPSDPSRHAMASVFLRGRGWSG